jgi:spore germination protein GerM
MSASRFPRPPHHTSPVIWFLLALLLILLAAGGWLLRDFWLTMATPPPAENQRPMRTVTLYFAVPDGSGLAAEGRQIVDCPAEEECIRATLQELIAGPVGSFAPVMPPRSVVRGVTVDGDGVLQIDFEKSLIDNHPGGSWAELLTVNALTNTVATNFPHLRQVRILIDGAAVDTLKGHIDLRQPVAPDFTLVNRVTGDQTPVIPAERPR